MPSQPWYSKIVLCEQFSGSSQRCVQYQTESLWIKKDFALSLVYKSEICIFTCYFHFKGISREGTFLLQSSLENSSSWDNFTLYQKPKFLNLLCFTVLLLSLKSDVWLFELMVATGQEKVREKQIPSRQGKSQGISLWARESLKKGREKWGYSSGL